jgi:hypothetical protein
MLGTRDDFGGPASDRVWRYIDDGNIGTCGIAAHDFAMLEVARSKRENWQHEPNHHVHMLALLVRRERMMIATCR